MIDRRPTPRLALVILAMGLAIAASPPRATAQTREYDPGDQVVLSSIDEVLKIEDRVVTTGRIHRVYTIGQVNGAWLWLEAEDVAGWVRADRVLPFDQALNLATSQIESAEEPGAELFVARGLLWADRGRIDLAEEDYSEAIRIEPEYRTPWINRALVRRATGRYDEAIDDLNQAVSLVPLDPIPYYNRGLVRLDLDQPKQAYDEFGLALRVEPNHPGARFNRAAVAVALGMEGGAADAEAFLVLVGWLETLSPYAAILAAIEHRREGRVDQADGLLRAALKELDPDSWPGPILSHLLGDLPLPDLLELADTPDRQAEARSYAGLNLLAADPSSLDDPDSEAATLLQWVVDQGEPSLLPHVLARLALDPPTAPLPDPDQEEEGSRQKAEGRRQRTEDKGQNAEDRAQKPGEARKRRRSSPRLRCVVPFFLCPRSSAFCPLPLPPACPRASGLGDSPRFVDTSGPQGPETRRVPVYSFRGARPRSDPEERRWSARTRLSTS